MTDTIENKLSNALISELKSTRRWKNIRFFIYLLLMLTFVFLLFFPFGDSSNSSTNGIDDGPYVSLVRLSGVIMPGNSFSAQEVIPCLNRAFRDEKAKGVVLLINSPGGSPVQASIIHDKIMQLKEKYHKEVIVVGEDTLASGAYLVATAADKIFVNKDTVTGSIGVIMEGFGFENAMEKLGITRRVFTAGTNKDRLDPFVALKPQDKEKIDRVLTSVHQDFIDDVMEGRKGKLNGNATELFSGDFWTGTQAVKLGLVDATANPWEAMKETFGTTYYRDYSSRPSFWQSVMKDVSTKLPLGLMASNAKLQEVL